jgi:hypothetical protein
MTTVMRWKNRCLELGIPGLEDYARNGRPARYKQEFKTTVLAKLEEEPPAGYSQWDSALLAVGDIQSMPFGVCYVRNASVWP